MAFARINGVVRKIDARADEYKELVFGKTKLSPSDAARKVAAEAQTHGWIPSPVQPGAALPLSAAEIKELYASTEALSARAVQLLAQKYVCVYVDASKPDGRALADELAVRGKAGLYPELKSPELYRSRHVDQVKLFVDVIRKNGLDKPESLKTTPVIIQSFDEEAVRRVAKELPSIPRVLLVERDGDVSEPRLRVIKTFATGVAPEKSLVAQHPEMVKQAHALGLTVTCWTFRADEKTTFASVRDEMAHFLYDLGIDALFTNNPDQFPRR